LSGVFLAENNVYNIGDGGLDSLRKRLFYANVHTTKAPGGEIRGNFLALANAYFTANLNSRNEVQPNSGSGAGAVKAELLGDRLTVTGSFANLTGNFNRDIAGGAHLHSGAAGVNGGVLISLKTDANADLKGGRFFSDSNSVVLTADQLALLNAGNLYVNIHSTTIPAGEIRGQLLFEPNAFPTAPTITKPISGDTITTDLRVKDTTYSVQWTAATDPDGNPLVYLIQTSIVPDFSLILNTAFIGPNLSFSASLGAVDTTLALLGIFPGGSATLFFRVLASDGSLATNSVPISVVLRRGLNTPVLDEFVKSFSVTVYPVPAREFAMLEMNATKANVLQLQILDMTGRLIHNEKINVQNGHNQFPIDMKKLSAGMHILSMSQNGKQVASFKLIKE
ncbi:MAG: CHRD domain-containing protein, partial [Saprospiraceae bacterium]|nr:CHRD domain-containing protein [Saprospiraceae bacterium]